MKLFCQAFVLFLASAADLIAANDKGPENSRLARTGVKGVVPNIDGAAANDVPYSRIREQRVTNNGQGHRILKGGKGGKGKSDNIFDNDDELPLPDCPEGLFPYVYTLIVADINENGYNATVSGGNETTTNIQSAEGVDNGAVIFSGCLDSAEEFDFAFGFGESNTL